MKKLIEKLSPRAVMALLAASGLLLFSGSIGGTRAALTYYSDVYSSRVELGNIGVTLLESGETDRESDGSDKWNEIAFRDYDRDGRWETESGDLLNTMLPKDAEGNPEDLKIGKVYKEKLKVKNTGAIGEYVRVSVYQYWTDESGDERNRNLDPEYIKLKFVNTGVGGDWLIDENAGTKERTVLYYRNVLPVDGETSSFTESIEIDPSITKLVAEETVSEKVTETTGGKETTTIKKSTYVYDGKQFCLEVEVDAVQDHNAKDAILSAWGKDVDLDGSGNIVKLNN